MLQTLIKTLTESYGPSGFEDEVRALIRAEIEPFADSIEVDALGNLIALKKGDGSGRKVMIAAHMDEIGFMVSHITEEGFLRFARLGGVSTLHLSSTRVRFADGTIGILSCDKRKSKTQIHNLDKYYIDVGATSRDDCPIQVGSAGIFWQPFLAQGDRLTAKSMDDRVGCAIAIAALQQIERSPHDLYFVFTVQEEVGVRGAMTAANRISAEIALALDVTLTSDTPNHGRQMAVELGNGPAIKIKDSGMIAHHGLVQLMRQRAAEQEIPYQLEILTTGSTDARAMQISGSGAAAGCISIPCRYIHSTSETVSLRDIEQSLQLLTTILTEPILI